MVDEVIAVGIFLTTAGMAKSLGSPLLLFVVWLAMGAMAVCGALCYGELAARCPKASGVLLYPLPLDTVSPGETFATQAGEVLLERSERWSSPRLSQSQYGAQRRYRNGGKEQAVRAIPRQISNSLALNSIVDFLVGDQLVAGVRNRGSMDASKASKPLRD